MTVVPLEGASDEGAFGGKAAKLAVAINRGLPVPRGVALSVVATARISRGDATAIDALEVALGAGGRFAVRSSAVGEDSAEASFAGLHLTCLNVPGDGVPEAVRAVGRSATSGPARSYRRRRGLADQSQGAGVIVQELIGADVAGVLFTRDPVTGADERVIEASWGLGEAVVAGEVVPDRFRLTPAGVVLERRAGVKDRLVAPAADGGTVIQEVAGEAVETPCLDDDGLAELAALGDRCEQIFGGPQDIEWAFAAGRLWLLQARPITARG